MSEPAKKRNRDPDIRPAIGDIKCPAGHAAHVKRQAGGRKLYYIHCGQCGGISASGQGWQEYILSRAHFYGDGEKPEPIKQQDPPKKPTENNNSETPQPKKKRRFWDTDPTLGF